MSGEINHSRHRFWAPQPSPSAFPGSVEKDHWTTGKVYLPAKKNYLSVEKDYGATGKLYLSIKKIIRGGRKTS